MKQDVIYQGYSEGKEWHQYLASITSCTIRTEGLNTKKKRTNARRLSKKHWLVKEGECCLVCRVMVGNNCILFPFVAEEEE